MVIDVVALFLVQFHVVTEIWDIPWGSVGLGLFASVCWLVLLVDVLACVANFVLV